MKKALAILTAILAVETGATPILDVSFIQNNWAIDIKFASTGFIPGDNSARLFVDGFLIGGSIGHPVGDNTGGLGGLIPDPLASPFEIGVYSPGPHFAWFLFNRPGVGDDIRIDGDEPYILVATTGPRPILNAPVSDSGSSASLFASGALAIMAVGRLTSRADA